MMMLLGILILLGAVLDIVTHAFTGLHTVLIGCGLLLVILNIFGNKLSFSKTVGKNVISLAILVIAALFLFGLFSADNFSASNNVQTIIKKTEKIFNKDGAVKAFEYIEEANVKMQWNRDLAYEMGKLYEESEKNDLAKNKYIEILSRDAFDINARYQFAKLLMLDKNYTQAINELSYIIRLNAKHADSYMSLGDCYWTMGDNIRGIYYYKLSVDEQEGSIEKRLKLAQAFTSMHSYEEAEAEYNKALERASSFDEEMMVYDAYSDLKKQTEKNSSAEQGGANK